MKKDPNRYPKGLDSKKVKAIIAYHDSQGDEAAAAEAEAAYVNSSTVLVRVPTELVGEVQALLARATARRSRRAGSASAVAKLLMSTGYKGVSAANRQIIREAIRNSPKSGESARRLRVER